MTCNIRIEKVGTGRGHPISLLREFTTNQPFALLDNPQNSYLEAISRRVGVNTSALNTQVILREFGELGFNVNGVMEKPGAVMLRRRNHYCCFALDEFNNPSDGKVFAVITHCF